MFFFILGSTAAIANGKQPGKEERESHSEHKITPDMKKQGRRPTTRQEGIDTDQEHLLIWRQQVQARLHEVDEQWSAIANHRTQVTEGLIALAEIGARLRVAQKENEEQLKIIRPGLAEIVDGERDVQQFKHEYDRALADIEAKRKEIRTFREGYKQGWGEIEAARQKIRAFHSESSRAWVDIGAKQKEIRTFREGYKQGWGEIEAARQKIRAFHSESSRAWVDIEAKRKEIRTFWEGYERAWGEIK